MNNKLLKKYAESIVSHLNKGADRDIALSKAKDVIKEVYKEAYSKGQESGRAQCGKIMEF